MWEAGERGDGRFDRYPALAVSLGLLLGAFGLRVFRLQQQSLTGDEAFSMLAAQRWLAGQMDLYGASSVQTCSAR